MCDWGAGGASGPGPGCGVGAVEACPGASGQEGGCQGRALAGQGSALWRGALGAGVAGEFGAAALQAAGEAADLGGLT